MALGEPTRSATSVAEGSLAETEYLLILSRDLGYLSTESIPSQLFADIEEILKMLNSLYNRVYGTDP